MSQIIKVKCPECGHIHTRNANRFSQKEISLHCKSCDTEFKLLRSPTLFSFPNKLFGNKKKKSQEIPPPPPSEERYGDFVFADMDEDEALAEGEVEVTWSRVALIYWAWMWRSLLLVIAFGTLFGFGIGFIASLINLIDIQPLFAAFGLIISLIISFIVLKKVLCLRFRNFRIALIRN